MPVAGFLEATAALRTAWRQCKQHYGERLSSDEDQLGTLESAEKLLDGALSNAECVLKGCMKLCQTDAVRPSATAPRPKPTTTCSSIGLKPKYEKQISKVTENNYFKRSLKVVCVHNGGGVGFQGLPQTIRRHPD